MPSLKPLTIHAVRHLAHSLAQELMDWGEPIPAFQTRYPNVLEACVSAPFQTFDKHLLYPGIEKKAAVLFYCLIKNHPFQNGNKRIAVTSLLVFLFLNKRWLRVHPAQLYTFAVWVAQSPPEVREDVLNAIQKFIKKYSESVNPGA